MSLKTSDKSKDSGGRYSHINFVPPSSVANAAKRGLDLRDKFNRGGTSVGIQRARDLSNRKNLSPSTVKRMHSFFARHSVNKRPGWSKPSDPSNGYIAWMLWGGDPGRSWASKVVKQMEAADSSKKSKKKASLSVRLASVSAKTHQLARLSSLFDEIL